MVKKGQNLVTVVCERHLIAIKILMLNFQFNSERIFTQEALKVKEITHDLNHNLILYCSHNSFWTVIV